MSLSKDGRWSAAAVRVWEAADLVGRANYEEIVIGQVDTGIRLCPAINHPWIDVARGKNFVEPSNPNPFPPNGPSGGNPEHGTRTLSVLAGESNADTFRGVLPGVRVIPYRAVDDVVLDTASERNQVANAVTDAIGKGAKVITISLGFPVTETFGALGKAIDEAYEKGVIVCAAGGQYVDSICYPAKYYRTIGVGGYTGYENGARSIYQDYRGLKAFVDVWAPANRIWRAEGVRPLGPTDPGEWGWGDGTSYATPHVAAAAALWLAHHGENALAAAYSQPWQRVEAFRLLLKRSAQSLTRYQGFEESRPARADEVPPGKGNDAGSSYVSGGLDVLALINWPLPEASALKLASPAVQQHV